ncbi:MAG TPA: hypothetical protein PK954_03210, partial [Anaerolineales bacterium]|nr:hypothetical protein [Anaerolineales bacterium]
SARLSLAGPATAADGRLRLLHSLELTRGAVLQVVGATLLINLPIIAMQAFAGLYTAGAGGAVAVAPTLAPWPSDAIFTEVPTVAPVTVAPSTAAALPSIEAAAQDARGKTPVSDADVAAGLIVFSLRSGAATHLWSYRVGDETPTRLTIGPWEDRDPAVSHDGRQIAYASRRQDGWNLQLLDLTTGATRQLTTGPEYEGHPTW